MFTAWIRWKPLPDRAPAAGFGSRTWLSRSSDQDLVPEQTGQDQEGFWPAESIGSTADGTRVIQPQHCSLDQGGRGTRDESQGKRATEQTVVLEGTFCSKRQIMVYYLKYSGQQIGVDWLNTHVNVASGFVFRNISHSLIL